MTAVVPGRRPVWAEEDGELVESFTYRQSYATSHRDSRRDAPALRSAAAGAWAFVSIIAAAGVSVVLLLVLVRVVGWLT